MSRKELFVVGIGPGRAECMTGEADAVLSACDVITGYPLYVDLVRERYPKARFETTGMRKEKERCRKALESASSGIRTALICSGDAAVYGLAGLAMETAERDYPEVEVMVIPGITAALSGGAVLGAPCGHDFCCISLSDLLTDQTRIEKRLRAAAEADFVLVLYNPGSRTRTDALKNAVRILLESRCPETVCGYVRNIGRNGEEHGLLTLGALGDFRADMLTTVFVGNAETRILGGRMVTPRGYPD